jgi:hypothetical protein
MKKLKLKNLSKAGNVPTSEELRHVYGGIGSGSGTGSGSGSGIYPKIEACIGLKKGDRCAYIAISGPKAGQAIIGHCAFNYFSGVLYCSDLPNMSPSI